MRRACFRIAAPALLLLLWSGPVSAGRNVSLYLDGAVVERSETARNGYLELSLPASVRADSLRIRPVGTAQISRVQLVPNQPGGKAEKELAALTKRQELLQDRLKALSIKEDIFRSAAKSQSAKAPRRTKTNPEPLATIRQGTDYAISQLEAVFQMQRRTNLELKQLEEKKGRLARDGQTGGTLARVWVTPPSAVVTATYLQSDRTWQPQYEVRVNAGDTARFAVFPGAPELVRGERCTVSLANVDKGNEVSSLPYRENGRAVMVADLPAVRKLEPAGPIPLMSVALTNTTGVSLPPGEISCYSDGIYQGRGRLPLLESGRTVELRCSSN